MKTEIFETYGDFLNRKDKTVNGVSHSFAEKHKDYEEHNKFNRGCWNCFNCFNCFNCSDCSDCSDCSGCSRCWNCFDCSDCWNCSDCSGCSRCSDCSDCWNCSDCSDCSRCSGCSRCWNCFDCSGLRNYVNSAITARSDSEGHVGIGNIPTVENLNQRVYENASKENGLNMSSWHSCNTCHCWAGWIVNLAGEEGKELEDKTSTEFAAMQIFKKSSGESINPSLFYLDDEQGMKKIKEFAEDENNEHIN